jgi:magnesium transporter
MDVRLLTEMGVEQYPVEALKALLDRDEGLVWVDIPTCGEAEVRVLSQVFGFHPLAIRDCVERNRVPRAPRYLKL